jgi:cell wall-associated NlpC family hydrolase
MEWIVYICPFSNIKKMSKLNCFFFALFFGLFGLSCSSLKPDTSNLNSADKSSNASPKFLNDISIGSNSGTAAHKGNASGTSRPVDGSAFNSDYKFPASIESYTTLQFKYAILTDVPVEEFRNEKLVAFVDEWFGTKYNYGGSTKDGIDCSAFVSLLMSSVYGVNNLPRMSKDQYFATPRIGKSALLQGDLVFFHTSQKRKKGVTHVGVYLCNNKFVHASISGVIISDLGDGYYAQHYVGAGRARE